MRKSKDFGEREYLGEKRQVCKKVPEWGIWNRKIPHLNIQVVNKTGSGNTVNEGKLDLLENFLENRPYIRKKESLFLCYIWFLIPMTPNEAIYFKLLASLKTVLETISLKYQKLLRFQHRFQYQWTLLWHGFKVSFGKSARMKTVCTTEPATSLPGVYTILCMCLVIKINQRCMYKDVCCDLLMEKDWKQPKHPLIEDLLN